MSAETLGRVIAEAVRTAPDALFLDRLVDGRRVRSTYAEEARLVGGVVARLRALGVAAGDRVVLQVDDMATCIHLALACFSAGIVPAFLAESFTSAYASTVAERGSARRVVTPADLDDLAPGPLGEPPVGASTDLCLIQPTSGSTGAPKLVLTPHASFTFGASRIFATGLAAGVEQHRVLMVSSIAHGIGMVNLVGALLHRAALVVPTAGDVAVSRAEVLELAPTFAYTTPRTVRALAAQAPAGQPLLGAAVRTLVVAGAPPDPELLVRLRGDGVAIHEMYGSSEAGDLAMTPPGAWRAGWVGPALDGVELSLAPDGELLARTPGAMLGYDGDPEATAAVLTEAGLCRTGDLAELDADGWVRLLGRRIAVINTAEGTNVHPERIERRLGEIEGIAQVAVVGNGRPHLVALLPPGEAAPPPAERAALEARIAAEIGRLNADLEAIEAVRGFVLLDHAFATAAYRRLGHDKLRVDRPALERLHAEQLDACYARLAATA